MKMQYAPGEIAISAREIFIRNFEAQIKEKLCTHVGGQPFFESIDQICRTPEFLEKLVRVLPRAGVWIATGTFGIALRNYLTVSGTNHHLILVRGGLRHLPADIDLEELRTLRGYSFWPITFIDDTLCTGGTIRRVAVELAKYKTGIDEKIVCYDGGKERIPGLISLYRYFDHHDLNGREL